MTLSTNSARINRALYLLRQEIEQNRVRVTTKSPSPRYPDGYQRVTRGSNLIGEIGIVLATEQLGRTDSFNG